MKAPCLRLPCLLLILCGILFPAAVAAKVILTGAGATFPFPLYREWFDRYHRQTGVRIDYQAVGSGGGIRRILEKEVDFGATDAFLSDSDLENLPEYIVHIPTCLGAVVLIYHLPGIPVLHLTPELIAGIFLGEIDRWSDERITKINPGLDLPDWGITVIHRSESSGTTFIFTDYLSRVSRSWAGSVGKGKVMAWPTGMGLERNAAVAEFVRKIPGSIGYAQLTYAKKNRLPAARIQNRSGRFITPTLEAVSAAADIPLPEDMRILITDTGAPDGYPISGFTYLILFQDQKYHRRSRERAEQLVRLLRWIILEGQELNHRLHYAPLPKAGAEQALEMIRSITYGDDPLGKQIE